MVLDVGTRFGAYEVAEPIGAGGMGEVYRMKVFWRANGSSFTPDFNDELERLLKEQREE